MMMFIGPKHYRMGYLAAVRNAFTAYGAKKEIRCLVKQSNPAHWDDFERGRIDAKLDMLDDMWSGRHKSNMFLLPHAMSQ